MPEVISGFLHLVEKIVEVVPDFYGVGMVGAKHFFENIYCPAIEWLRFPVVALCFQQLG